MRNLAPNRTLRLTLCAASLFAIASCADAGVNARFSKMCDDIEKDFVPARFAAPVDVEFIEYEADYTTPRSELVRVPSYPCGGECHLLLRNRIVSSLTLLVRGPDDRPNSGSFLDQYVTRSGYWKYTVVDNDRCGDSMVAGESVTSSFPFYPNGDPLCLVIEEVSSGRAEYQLEYFSNKTSDDGWTIRQEARVLLHNDEIIARGIQLLLAKNGPLSPKNIRNCGSIYWERAGVSLRVPTLAPQPAL